jgi:hypothetical protein
VILLVSIIRIFNVVNEIIITVDVVDDVVVVIVVIVIAIVIIVVVFGGGGGFVEDVKTADDVIVAIGDISKPIGSTAPLVKVIGQ